MAKKGNRIIITLECQEERDGSKCADRSYVTEKNKKNSPDRLEIRKYCPKCRKSTIHKEVK